MLQANSDSLTDLLSASDSEFSLKSGSFDFDKKLNSNGPLKGVLDFDYEMFDLRPTLPNILFDSVSGERLNSPVQNTLVKQKSKLEQIKSVPNLNLDLTVPNLADSNLQQPFVQQNLEKDFFKQEQLKIEAPNLPRKFNENLQVTDAKLFEQKTA